MPQSYTESLTYFSQILKADIANMEFPYQFALLQYVNYLFLCSPSQGASTEDCLYLLWEVFSENREDSWLLPDQRLK